MEFQDLVRMKYNSSVNVPLRLPDVSLSALELSYEATLTLAFALHNTMRGMLLAIFRNLVG